MRSSITLPAAWAGAVTSSPTRSAAQATVRSPSGCGAAADQRDRAEHRTTSCAAGIVGTDQRPAARGDQRFGVRARLQAAIVTLTAGTVSRVAGSLSSRAICSASALDRQRGRDLPARFDALAGPHLQLQDWVLDQDAVHVDETGWRTRGEGRALWTATTPGAAFLEIADTATASSSTR